MWVFIFTPFVWTAYFMLCVVIENRVMPGRPRTPFPSRGAPAAGLCACGGPMSNCGTSHTASGLRMLLRAWRGSGGGAATQRRDDGGRPRARVRVQPLRPPAGSTASRAPALHGGRRPTAACGRLASRQPHCADTRRPTRARARKRERLRTPLGRTRTTRRRRRCRAVAAHRRGARHEPRRSTTCQPTTGTAPALTSGPRGAARRRRDGVPTRCDARPAERRRRRAFVRPRCPCPAVPEGRSRSQATPTDEERRRAECEAGGRAPSHWRAVAHLVLDATSLEQRPRHDVVLESLAHWPGLRSPPERARGAQRVRVSETRERVTREDGAAACVSRSPYRPLP